MANYREDFADVELQTGKICRNFMNQTIGSGDALGDRFGVHVFRDGEPVTLGGSCAGYFVRNATGETIVISGGVVSGNEAYVTLPAACYAVEGSFTLAIKVTSGDEVVTLRIVDGMVDRTNTSVIVDPGNLVPSIEDLIDAIDAAVASIPADYSSLWTSLAPAFSTSTNYTAGQYVTYNGAVYQFTVDHPAGTWNSAHVTATNLGSELSSLKSAFTSQIQNENIIPFSSFEYGYFSGASAGNPLTFNILSSPANRISLRRAFSFTETDSLLINVDTGYRYMVFKMDTSDNYVSQEGWKTGKLITQPGYHYFFTFAKTNDGNVTFEDLAHISIESLNNSANDNIRWISLNNNILGGCQWINGVYSISGTSLIGSFNDANSRITLPQNNYIEVTKDALLTIESGYKLLILKCDLTNAYIEQKGWLTYPFILESGYRYKLVLAKSNDGAIKPEDYKALQLSECPSIMGVNIAQGYWQTYSQYTFTTSRLCNKSGTYIEADRDIEVIPDTGYKVYIHNFNKSTKEYIGVYSAWRKYPITLDKQYSYRIMLANNSDSNIYPNEINHFAFVEKEYIDTESEYVSKTHQTPFLLNEENLIEKVLADKDANTITFGLITDTHHSNSENQRTAKQAFAMGMIADRVGADFTVHLGDVIEGGLSTLALNKGTLSQFWSLAHLQNTPMLYTIAHHEQYGSGMTAHWHDDATACSESVCIGMYGRMWKHLPIVRSADKCSWYSDIECVRFIGLDSSSNTQYGFSQDVVDFLTSALNTENKIVIFSHAAPYSDVMINDYPPENGSLVISAMSEKVNDIYSFFHGHTHWDNMYKPDGGVNYISTCCALPVKTTSGFCSKGNPTVYNRTVGDYSEYCFDIVNIHKDTGIIKMFRFGAGSDRQYPST